MNFLKRIFGSNPNVTAVVQSFTFLQFLSNNTQELCIEARGDRVGGKITYQWRDHGPFTVEKGVSDETTTIVTISQSLVEDFAWIVSRYKDYLAPWKEQGVKIPKVVVNKMLQDLNA